MEAFRAPGFVGANWRCPSACSYLELDPKSPRSIFHKPKPSLVLVRLTVSAEGIPTDVHVIKSGGDTFDKGCTEGSETISL